MITATVKVTKDNVKDLLKDLKALTDYQVLVGVPLETSARDVKGKEKLTNAALAIIHDKGSPLAGIPARPFMKPGIAKVQNRINNYLASAARAKLDGDEGGMMTFLHESGLLAQNSIRNVIREGEGFAPLKRGTLLAKTRKRAYAWGQLTKEERAALSSKERQALRKQRREEVMASFHPLIDTGEMLKSISYSVQGPGNTGE